MSTNNTQPEKNISTLILRLCLLRVSEKLILEIFNLVGGLQIWNLRE